MNRRSMLGVLATGPVFAAGAHAAEQVSSMQSFRSGGARIAVEFFAAAGSGSAGGPAAGGPSAKAPGLLLLHGADGLTFADGYRLAARATAANGYHVAFVHWFDRFGEPRIDYSKMKRRFTAFSTTVEDALNWLAGRPEVDSDRLGIVGVSLGASLGMEVASRDSRIKALVDYFGPVPDGVAARKPRLPPTLILHGSADTIVPVGHAHALETLLKRNNTPYEIQIYEGQGHGFVGMAQLESASRVSAFLARHLKASGPGDGRPT